jgi:uncharacterized protein (TIGR02594 family)
MHEIIDVAGNVAPFASRLAGAGVKTVIRYYNHRNGEAHPSKCLTRPELLALHNAGLSVGVVFEQRGGAGGNIVDLDAESGVRDARRALDLAGELQQPEGSAIYFGVDWDFSGSSDLAQITSYFENVNEALSGKYLIGVYGSGTVGLRLRQQALVDHVWLAGATGWSGTKRALRDGSYTIFQKSLEKRSEIGGFDYDGNVVNPSFESFGQFAADGARTTPHGTGSAALFEVVARSGLNLRSGPGETFAILDTLPRGTIVTGIGRDGAWIKVDIEGDGHVDGYMFQNFLEPVSGGLPIDPAAGDFDTPRRPIDFARQELKLGVREQPGRADNPRIVMYHQTTCGGAAHDETPWCSSFVNYCVRKAGLQGTDDKWALSWHERGFGQDVTADPKEGDIVVFRRFSPTGSGGHVGFFVGQHGDKMQILGGNQDNAVSIAPFPTDGDVGRTHYSVASIRRAIVTPG